MPRTPFIQDYTHKYNATDKQETRKERLLARWFHKATGAFGSIIFLVMCARADRWGAESFCDDALARRREGVARDSTVVCAYVHTHVGGRCPGVKNLAIIIVHHCTFLSLVAILVEPCLHNHRLKIPLCHLINLSHQKRLWLIGKWKETARRQRCPFVFERRAPSHTRTSLYRFHAQHAHPVLLYIQVYWVNFPSFWEELDLERHLH
jgi:hypothetical protein